MPDIRFVTFLKTLKPEDWEVLATSKWTVKDVVAHMIGWEREDVAIIKSTWQEKTKPWWMVKNDDEAFNAKWVKFYKDYSPVELIKEWEMWQAKVRQEMAVIGEENLSTHLDLFAWLFEGVDSKRADGSDGHYKHHFEQIKKALGVE